MHDTKDMNDMFVPPQEYVEFCRLWPKVAFIEWVDHNSSETLNAVGTTPFGDCYAFAKDPSGDPFVFLDTHVALLDRATGEGEWYAKDFHEFVFIELANSAQFDDEPTEAYATFFSAEQNAFLSSLPIDEDLFDDQLEALTPWSAGQTDFRWEP